MKSTRWIRSVSVAVVVLIMFVTGYSLQQITAFSAEATPRETLVVAVPGTAPNLDEDQSITAEGEMVLSNVHIGDLFMHKIIPGPRPGTLMVDLKSVGDRGVQGLLAKSWKMSADGRTITIDLKRGVKSPYGNEFTAEMYKWAWERGFALNAVRKFFADVLGIASPNSVRVLGKYQVQVRLKGPSPIFFKLVAEMFPGGPFDSVEVRKHTTTNDPWAKEWTRTHTAGFGPYHVERLVPGVETVLVKNPYWTGAPVFFKRVILKAVPESSSRLALLKAGQVDIAWQLTERELRELEAHPNLKVIRTPSNKETYIGLVVNKPPLNNVKVRQALAWATPYDDILQKVYFGRARRMDSIVPFIFAGYVPTYKYQTDLNRAKQLLSAAGYPNGFELTLAYDSSQNESEQMAILVKSSWEQVGVRVTLRAMPTGAYTEQKYGKKLQAYSEGTTQWPLTGDPGYALWIYLANGPRNFINAVSYDNPTYNDLVERSVRTLDSPKRAALTTRAQQIAAQEVPWIQVAWPDWSVAAKKDLEGFLWGPVNQLYFFPMTRK